MKKVLKFSIFWGVVGLVILLSSCANQGIAPSEPSQPLPYNEYFEETTSSDGRATLIVGGAEIRVTVTDDEGNPLRDIKVMGYDLGNGKILLIAEDPNENYFRDYKLISIENKFPVVTAAFALYAAVKVGAVIYHYARDPSELPIQVIETLDESNKVVKEVRLQVDVDDLLQLISLISAGGTLAKTAIVFGSPATLRGVTAISMGFLRSRLLANVEGDLAKIVARTVIESIIGQLSDRDIINITLFKVGEREIPIAKVDIEYGPNAEIADYRFVLMWLEQPRDLDAHMKVFNENVLVDHVYYINKGSKEEYPYVQLDVDDTDSYGPENIFVWNLMNNLDYVFFVYNFSGERRLKNCGAVVRVFHGRELIDFIKINDAFLSDSEGRYWYVGFIKDGVWHKKNQVISYEPNAP